uniref:Transmembrane protein n=1 Tax=Chromera velia CCMP2878 TaxID=1169474 RepID=A0A0G4GUU9_9ALVE|eukprot:Cvel_23486.t1-p1 / transcript=Cvel_23486.t1 / gene=Cvel_23486 / organism=Chromera_velia_CCMP2878 / gene_product=hypothetical protein / transcript_product=hypothetical protein / location=Cvel_scaffold2425:24453-26360(+) / protein_length=636 / sequence_SO=supercontig / SO=protein_coding / is_pseudo=false
MKKGSGPPHDNAPSVVDETLLASSCSSMPRIEQGETEESSPSASLPPSTPVFSLPRPSPVNLLPRRPGKEGTGTRERQGEEDVHNPSEDRQGNPSLFSRKNSGQQALQTLEGDDCEGKSTLPVVSTCAPKQQNGLDGLVDQQERTFCVPQPATKSTGELAISPQRDSEEGEARQRVSSSLSSSVILSAAFSSCDEGEQGLADQRENDLEGGGCAEGNQEPVPGRARFSQSVAVACYEVEEDSAPSQALPVQEKEEGVSGSTQGGKRESSVSRGASRCLLPSNLDSKERGTEDWYGSDLSKWTFRNVIRNRNLNPWIGIAIILAAVGAGLSVPILRLSDMSRAVREFRSHGISPGALVVLLYTQYSVTVFAAFVGLVGFGFSPRTPAWTWALRVPIFTSVVNGALRLLDPFEGLLVAYATAGLYLSVFFVAYSVFSFPGASWINHGLHVLRCTFILYDYSSEIALGLLTIEKGVDLKSDLFLTAGVCIVVCACTVDVPLLVYNLEHNHVRTVPLSNVFRVLLWMSMFAEFVVLGSLWFVSPFVHGESSEEEKGVQVTLLVITSLLTILGVVDKILLLRGFDVMLVIEQRFDRVKQSVTPVLSRMTQRVRDTFTSSRAQTRQSRSGTQGGVTVAETVV